MDGLLTKVSITDRRGLILHHIGICLFLLAATLKTIQIADGTQNIECYYLDS